MSKSRGLLKWLSRILVFLLLVLGVSLAKSFIAGIIKHEILLIGITAFFGAFFAFGFDRLSERLTAFRKAVAKHFSALVEIERLLNRTYAQLDRNVRLGREDIEALKSMRLVVWNLPPIPYRFELAEDLRNIDFVNDYFTFTMDLETLNRDMVVMMSAYNEAKSTFLSMTVSPKVYKDNVEFTANMISEIIKFMENYQAEAAQLLAKTRVLLRERKPRIVLLGAWPKLNYAKDFNDKVGEELSALKHEIDEISKKSQADIDRIKGAP